MTGAGNDLIHTDAVLSGQNENGHVTSTNDDLNDYVVIDGGNGTDTVTFGKDISEYTITVDANGYTIVTESAHSDSNDDGKGDVTELRNIETIKFNDTIYDIAINNITFIVDVSSSMDANDLLLAKEAMSKIIEQYEELGNVKVNIIQTWGGENREGVGLDSTGWKDSSWDITLFNDKSGTDFDQGLKEAEHMYNELPSGSKNSVYFIADGNTSNVNDDVLDRKDFDKDFKAYMPAFKNFIDQENVTLDLLALRRTELEDFEYIADEIDNVNITDFANVSDIDSLLSSINPSYKTPIILDLDGDGIETISLSNGVEFDIDNDGDIDLTGWVGEDDALLVRDINKDGIINDASELFGEETIKEDGIKASDGYDALRELDSNEDGVINALDDSFSELNVWKDSNSDGITDEGELLSLKEAGVAEISLGTIESTQTSNGNIIGLKSTYTNIDGEELAAADVWFEIEANDLVLDDDIDLGSAKFEPEVDKMALNNQNLDLKGVLLADEEEYIIFGENENSISLQESDLKWVKQDENEIIDDEEFKVFESTFSADSHIKIFIDNDIDVDI